MFQKKPSSYARRNIFFYDAETQFENLGDLVINRLLLEELRSFGELVINLDAVPSWYADSLKVLPHERFSKSNKGFEYCIFLEGLKNFFKPSVSTYIIQLPGHYSGGVPGRLSKKVLYFLLLKLINVKVCRFGASIDSFTEKRKWLERWQSKMMHYYSVRDHISIKYAQEIGICSPKFFPDLAWFSTPNSYQKASVFVERENAIFSFRAPRIGSEDVEAAYYRSFWESLDVITKTVCNDLAKKVSVIYQVERDKAFATKIFNRYRDSYNIEFVDCKIDDISMKSVYSDSLITFSNRLHVLMMSMAYGSVPIGLIDPKIHRKILGVFDSAELEGVIFDMYDSKSIPEKIKDMLTNSDHFRQSALAQYESNKVLGRKIMSEVLR